MSTRTFAKLFVIWICTSPRKHSLTELRCSSRKSWGSRPGPGAPRGWRSSTCCGVVSRPCHSQRPQVSRRRLRPDGHDAWRGQETTAQRRRAGGLWAGSPTRSQVVLGNAPVLRSWTSLLHRQVVTRSILQYKAKLFREERSQVQLGNEWGNWWPPPISQPINHSSRSADQLLKSTSETCVDSGSFAQSLKVTSFTSPTPNVHSAAGENVLGPRGLPTPLLHRGAPEL